MRSMIKSWVLSVLFIACTAAAASAQMSIVEEYHVDPGWEAGGYWEFTVTNNTGDDVFFIAVGNNFADLIVVRYPDLTGVWYPVRISAEEWDANDFNFQPTAWTPPDLSDYPTSVHFPGAQQVLVYYVLGSNPGIANGMTQDGFYFNYPMSGALTSSARSAAAAGSSFLAFNGAGEVVAQGTTVGPALATEPTTWGSVKALFR